MLQPVCSAVGAVRVEQEAVPLLVVRQVGPVLSRDHQWWPRPGIMVIAGEVSSMLVHLVLIEVLEQSGLSTSLEAALGLDS